MVQKNSKPDPSKKQAKVAPAKPAAKKTAVKKPVAKKGAPVKGKTKGGQPKKHAYPDTMTEAPVLPDKDPQPTYIEKGLELGLNLREIEFVEVYLTCYNGVRCYQQVYGQQNYNVAAVEAHKLMRRPKVREYLGMRMKSAFERTEEAQDAIIQAYTHLAYGDVNELIEYRREACRFCHGDGHLYQSTPEEMRAARDSHGAATIMAKKDGITLGEFDEKGGVGFDPRREPHPECPECFGEGRGRIHFHDTRNLSPAALALYEGAEVTKDGLKIKTASRDGAREKLAKILKVFEDTKTEVTISLNATDLEVAYGERMRKARERANAMRQERGIKDGD